MIKKQKFLKTLSKLTLGISAIGLAVVESHAQAVRGQNFNVTEQYVPGELLVKYSVNASALSQSSVVSRYAFEEIKRFRNPSQLQSAAANAIGMERWSHVRVKDGQDIEALREALAAEASIERVEYNYLVRADIVPNDPRFDELWGMNNVGQTGGLADADIDAPEAWDVQTGSSDVIVGVIDTGVDYNHPDLAANMWVNVNEIPGNGIDDDDNGYIDDIYGYDFVNDDADPMDDHGHGTHVAGTVAAVGNNGIGVAGVSWNSKIMALKFLGATGGGAIDDAIGAVLYATEMGADLTNNSWGGGGFSQAMGDAIEAANSAGSLFVAAAGNSNSDNDVFPHYPSSYDSENVIAVAALDHADLRAGFSSYGATTVDLGAPGVDILSTSLTATGAIFDPSGYTAISGTSMATPHVAGAAAIVISEFPDASHTEIKSRLLGTARPVDALQGLVLTGGALHLPSSIEDDDVAPVPVLDLAASEVGAYSTALTWSASGDDGEEGGASTYDLRYSTLPIDATNFEDAESAVVNSSVPFGGQVTYVLDGLETETTYFVALKALDNVGNIGGISNVIEFTTESVTVVYENPLDDMSDWVVEGTEGPEGPLWHVSSHRFDSPENAFYYGVESTLTYDTGAANSGTVTSPPIDLSMLNDGVLSFSHFLETEGLSPFDTATVDITVDAGETWVEIFSDANGTLGDMVKVSVDISPYVGQVVQVRFGFDTLDSLFNAFEGWVVDDLEISGSLNGPVAVLEGPFSAIAGGLVGFDGSGSTFAEDNVYLWDFGDGQTMESTSPIVTHQYLAPGQYTVSLVVSNESGTSEAATAAVFVIAAYAESFDGYAVGEVPEEWDGALGMDLSPVPGLIEAVELDGESVLASTTPDLAFEAYYTGDVPFNVSGGYEFSGKMRTLEEGSEIGVTFFNHRPLEYGYYTLKSYGGTDGFHIAATMSVLDGDTQSEVTPESAAYEWLRFRVHIIETGSRVEIRANVWADGTEEPEGWQIDAYDESIWRKSEGTVGVWGGGSGQKYWDDLLVSSIGELPVATIVPDVSGLEEAEAESVLLEESGLMVSVSYAYNNSGVPEGVVFDQKPAAGELSFEGSASTIIVSLGPLFYFDVPGLLGLSVAEAEESLAEKGFVVGEVSSTFSSDVPVGLVVAQDPDAGVYITTGSAVDLTISLGVEP